MNRAARVCLSVARRIRSQIGASTCGTMTGQQYLSVYLRDAGRSACQDLFAAAVLMHHSLYSCCAGRKKKEHAFPKVQASKLCCNKSYPHCYKIRVFMDRVGRAAESMAQGNSQNGAPGSRNIQISSHQPGAGE